MSNTVNRGVLGEVGTATALVLNFINWFAGIQINQTLTIIISALSIIYLLLQIEQKIKDRRKKK